MPDKKMDPALLPWWFIWDALRTNPGEHHKVLGIISRNEQTFNVEKIDTAFATKAALVLKAAVATPSTPSQGLFIALIKGGIFRPEVFDFIAAAKEFPEKHRDAWLLAKEVAAGIASPQPQKKADKHRVLAYLQGKYLNKRNNIINSEAVIDRPDVTPTHDVRGANKGRAD